MMGGYVSRINTSPGSVRAPTKMDVAQNAHRHVVYSVMNPPTTAPTEGPIVGPML